MKYPFKYQPGNRVVERGEVLLRQPPSPFYNRLLDRYKDDISSFFFHLGYLLYG
jgi:hypothetical protein